jgi:glyoxylase I family protein
MIIEGIDHVVLRVRNLERAEDFYTRILGCTIERRQEPIGMVQLRAGASLIDLISVDGVLGRKGGAAPGHEGHNMDHLCLRLADFDLDSVREHLTRNGVAVGEVGSRYGASGEGTSLYLEDIDGNRLELRAP